MKLTFKTKKKEASDAWSLFFEPEKPVSWEAGQFMHYVLPGENERKDEMYFTISSAPHEKHIAITTRFFEKRSDFKNYLFNLAAGDTIEADGPSGDFTAPAPGEEAVFMAGGIGITPYRSILTDLHHRKLPMNIKLLYGNKTYEFFFGDELEGTKKLHPEFGISYFVEPRRITEEVIMEAIPKNKRPVFYVSGPEPMVEFYGKMLSGMGIPASRTKYDYFPGYDWM